MSGAPSLPFLGEACALLAAICWSYATILFRRAGETVPPLALNLSKNSLTLVLFVASVLITQAFPQVPPSARDRWMLLLSGAIGIGLSDAFYFMTLNRVGAGLQAIITTSYSPSIIALSILFLGERLSLPQSLGVTLILGAVLAVLYTRGDPHGLSPRTLARGVLFGLLATSTQAVSIVMIKPLLEVSPLFWANSWRLLGGLVVSILLYVVLPARRGDLAALRSKRLWVAIAPGSVLGSYVSLMFWLGGMKFTQASTAAALNQTSTLFTFLFAALMLHEPITRRRMLALALGLAGIAFVTFGG
ncbi:MAG: DMT family transporter [Candidatus Eisenbacteria bacterium]|nr:DMT family transporter [Candidatus Eisenbacteria bacterium]MCC7141011.1 DMT family transporter [Candidatus Eisenbacteria bacterium]